MSHHTAFTLSGLCAVGGLLGYAKTGSVPSALAGLGFSALFAANGKFIAEQRDYAYDGAAASSFLLTAVQAPRAIKLRKPVPISLASIGLISGIYYVKKAYEERYGV